MLLTLTSTSKPATDIGFLLHKHPDRVQDFSLPFGRANVFYPEATDERTTVALLVEIDPVELVRKRRHGRSLSDYVNDRPYVASSFMSVAISRVFGSALRGKADTRAELVDSPLALEASLPVVASYGGSQAILDLFEPLGYEVTAKGYELSAKFPQWGQSNYFSIRLEGSVPLRDLLVHLYVLLPVLDGSKHYWVDQSEIDKLLNMGEGWLADHPSREQITRLYMKGQRSLADEALQRLFADDGTVAVDEVSTEEVSLPLNRERLDAVADQLMRAGARRIIDVGCGEGRLVGELLKEPTVAHVSGMDVSVAALKRASRRLRLNEMSHRQRERVSLFQGALTYRDDRLRGFDAAAVVEVIEHLDPWQLPAFEEVLFGDARPRTVVLTTPNAEYNVEYEHLDENQHRHADHRFEWTRAEFAEWSHAVSSRYGYSTELIGIGPESKSHGTPTQMAVFTAQHEGSGQT